MHMYTFFGDPGMTVTYPGMATKVSVSPSTASAGAKLTVTATFSGLSSAAEAIVSLESARRVILGAISPVPADGDPSRDGVIAQNYGTANDKVAAAVTVPTTGSSLSTTLTIPANLPAGQYHIKIFAHDSSSDFVGSAPLTVK